MFTGDRSGDWLYRAMHKAGFASQSASTSAKDGLKLIDCVITAVCHCAPPDNKPSTDEVTACAEWFEKTIELCQPSVYLALGQLAWKAVLRDAKRRRLLSSQLPKFGHATEFRLNDGTTLIGCYHPSQQNTFTGRLTVKMLDDVFARAKRLINS